ncbi:acdA [Symbiodinium microadriaticum]|nr:acdA [Symbiodinium microadriaticum]
MDFDFNDEQKMLRDQAQKFLEDKCPRDVPRAVLESEDGYDKNLWSGLAEMGFLGAAIPEEFGGLGLGHLELCVIAEELGRSLAPVPVASSIYLCAEGLLIAGSDEQKSSWLPKLASGEAIGTMAVSEGNRPASAKNLETRFEGGKLNGRKIPVPDGAIADVAIVIAASEKGTAAVLVDLNGDGVSREVVRTMDPSRPQAIVEFKDAPAELLGNDGEGWDIKEQIYDRAAILIAFEQVGGSTAAIEMAKEYAQDRIAFGRQIASFQAIKHKLADMYVKTELARSHAYYGAWALSTNAPELPVAAAGARSAACDAYYFTSKENIQTHGGVGFTWEMDCHLFYRRAKQLNLVIGSGRYWKDKLITQLEKRNAA